MARRKTPVKHDKFRLELGVGFDASPDAEYPCTLKSPPAVAIAMHPIYGIRCRGPFLSRHYAAAWISREGDEELLNEFGCIRGASWHVAPLDVPRTFGH